MSITLDGRIILSALQATYKHDGNYDEKFHSFAECLLSTMFKVTIAWARINKGGIFEAYFYNESDARKVADGLGWIVEIKKVNDSDYRLLMNV